MVGALPALPGLKTAARLAATGRCPLGLLVGGNKTTRHRVYGALRAAGRTITVVRAAAARASSITAFMETVMALYFSRPSCRSFAVVGVIAALLTAPLAHAESAADAARARIDAIASGNETAINAAYAPGAVLEWVGGPLDGRYATPQSIAAVWAKFAKANPHLQARVSDLKAAVNPKGATVSADVVFSGKSNIPVRYVLTYREGKLVAEIWQVDPELAASGGY
ncbi:MAG: nuclear transport factor 2 family protein [Thiomonas sp.]